MLVCCYRWCMCDCLPPLLLLLLSLLLGCVWHGFNVVRASITAFSGACVWVCVCTFDNLFEIKTNMKCVLSKANEITIHITNACIHSYMHACIAIEQIFRGDQKTWKWRITCITISYCHSKNHFKWGSLAYPHTAHRCATQHIRSESVGWYRNLCNENSKVLCCCSLDCGVCFSAQSHGINVEWAKVHLDSNSFYFASSVCFLLKKCFSFNRRVLHSDRRIGSSHRRAVTSLVEFCFTLALSCA